MKENIILESFFSEKKQHTYTQSNEWIAMPIWMKNETKRTIEWGGKRKTSRAHIIWVFLSMFVFGWRPRTNAHLMRPT